MLTPGSLPLCENHLLAAQGVLHDFCHNNPLPQPPLWWAQRQADRSTLLTRPGLQAAGREMTQLAALGDGDQGYQGD